MNPRKYREREREREREKRHRRIAKCKCSWTSAGAFLHLYNLQALEDGDEHAVEHFEHLVVVLVERHLHVQAHKLGQVTVRVRVLRPKHCKTRKKEKRKTKKDRRTGEKLSA